MKSIRDIWRKRPWKNRVSFFPAYAILITIIVALLILDVTNVCIGGVCFSITDGIGGNIFAELIGIILTIFLVEKVLQKDTEIRHLEENRRNQQTAFIALYAPLYAHIYFLKSLAPRLVTKEGKVNVTDYFMDDKYINTVANLEVICVSPSWICGLDLSVADCFFKYDRELYMSIKSILQLFPHLFSRESIEEIYAYLEYIEPKPPKWQWFVHEVMKKHGIGPDDRTAYKYLKYSKDPNKKWCIGEKEITAYLKRFCALVEIVNEGLQAENDEEKIVVYTSSRSSQSV